MKLRGGGLSMVDVFMFPKKGKKFTSHIICKYLSTCVFRLVVHIGLDWIPRTGLLFILFKFTLSPSLALHNVLVHISHSDREIVVYPGILVPSRILSCQQEFDEISRTCCESFQESGLINQQDETILIVTNSIAHILLQT